MVRVLNRKQTLSSEENKRRSKRRRVTRAEIFIDPFPAIHGTLPEKMVYAALSRRGIKFYFLNDFRFKIPEIKFDKYYQADFMIPSLKLIIEVQGAYWHSMEKTVKADAFKFAIYETLGYKVLPWWDFDILSRLDDLFLQEPLLRGLADFEKGSTSTELKPQRRTKIDSSKGIRTLNRKKRKALSYLSPRVKQKKRRSTKKIRVGAL